MTCQEVMSYLETLGSPAIKKVLINHGAKEPFFGVKVGDLKTIEKMIKKDYQLALELYDTGNSDAMYLAGLIADDDKMTQADLQKWAEKAHWAMQSEYTVPWVAAQGKLGYEMGMQWIDSPSELIACAGWCTLSFWVSLKADRELDLAQFKALLDRVETTIHAEQNRVKYCMNGFIISVGSYVAVLSDYAETIAQKVGKVSVNQGNTACKVPDALDYILKVKSKNDGVAKKKKKVKC